MNHARNWRRQRPTPSWEDAKPSLDNGRRALHVGDGAQGRLAGSRSGAEPDIRAITMASAAIGMDLHLLISIEPRADHPAYPKGAGVRRVPQPKADPEGFW